MQGGQAATMQTSQSPTDCSPLWPMSMAWASPVLPSAVAMAGPPVPWAMQSTASLRLTSSTSGELSQVVCQRWVPLQLPVFGTCKSYALACIRMDTTKVVQQIIKHCKCPPIPCCCSHPAGCRDYNTTGKLEIVTVDNTSYPDLFWGIRVRPGPL